MKRMMIITVLIATALTATMAMAQQRRGQQGARSRATVSGKPGIEALNLSDEQKEKIRSLKSASMKEGVELRAKQKVARIELHELMAVENPDKNKIDSKISEIGKLNETMLRHRVESRLAFLQVLTPEQRKKAKELRLFSGKHRRRQPFQRGMRGRGGRFPRGPRPGGPGAAFFPPGIEEGSQAGVGANANE